jgi:hypothetical protein
VALVYLPCAMRLRDRSVFLRDTLMGKAPTDSADAKRWAEVAEKLDTVVPVDDSRIDRLKELIPIVSPLAAALLQAISMR